MESLTVTLHTAKKLKAVGFPEKGVYNFWFAETVDGDDVLAWFGGYGPGAYEEAYAAPTAQEIADQLPRRILLNKQDDGRYMADDGVPWSGNEQWADTMAEALAALWLKLKEGAE
jgi:hypothetical protein